MGEAAEEMIQISVVPRSGSTRSNQIFPDFPQNLPIQKNPPLDSWLPVTGSRNGNAYYAAFHVLNSGIGFQAFTLPVAFTILGW